MLKRFISGILVLFILAGCSSSIKTVVKKDIISSKKYKNVAVIPFNGPMPKVGEALADSFIVEVMDIGFDVIERSQLDKILEEQKISTTGLIDTETVHQIGKIAGVDMIVLGGFHCRKEENKTVVARHRPILRRPIGRRMHVLVPKRQIVGIKIEDNLVFDEISVRFVDVETGKVVVSSILKKKILADEIDDCISKIASSIKEKIKSK